MTTRPLTPATYAYVQALNPGDRFTLEPAAQIYSVAQVTPTTIWADRITPAGLTDGSVQIGQRRWPSVRVITEETA